MTMPGDTDPTLGAVDAHGSDRGTDGALDTKASKVYELNTKSRRGSFRNVWWRHALALGREHGSRAAESCCDLVENQQRAVGAARLGDA